MIIYTQQQLLFYGIYGMQDIGIGLGTSVLNHTQKVKACSIKLINQRTQISLAEWYIISDNPLPV